MAEYGLPTGPHPDWEVDHLIPLCLGGADDDKNLWPEPRRGIEKEWPAELKDDLEHRLCQLVCNGELDVAEAHAKSRSTGPSRTAGDSDGRRDDWRASVADWLAKTR
jgi:hypothetical protein